MKRIVLVSLLVLLAVSALAATPTVSVKGQIIDTYCYAANGEQGEKHAGCGMGCLKNGVPAGLLEGEKVYILLGNGEGKPVPQELKEKVGKTVTVTGHSYTKGGTNFLVVESFK